MTADVNGPAEGHVNRREFLEKTLALLAASVAAGAGSHLSAQQPTAHQSVPHQPTTRFFPGFRAIRIGTSGATINGVVGGKGPPLLLLHGFPQTHVEWHRVAPMLARDFTVVATDLRGYGDSSKPGEGINHAGYSKRATAVDQIEVMQQLGYDRFAVVAHDRGARVAHRMALDHPERVSRLVVMDIVPTYKLLQQNVMKAFATAYYHWFFLIQPAPFPETLISNSAEFFLGAAFGGLVPSLISNEVFDEYLRCFTLPGTIHAMCEDYRAAATIDLEHDEADIGTKIQCPLLALWGKNGAMHSLYDVLETWKERASDVRGKALMSGHWLPEEKPDEVYSELRKFLE